MTSDFWDFLKEGIAPNEGVLYTGAALAADDTGDAVAAFGQEYVQLALVVSACTGGAVADKLDVLVDRRVTGGAWVNVAHFPQVAGNAAAKKYIMALDRETPDSTPMADSLDYSADVAANVARPLVIGDEFRVRAVIVDDTGDPQAEPVVPSPTWDFVVTACGR